MATLTGNNASYSKAIPEGVGLNEHHWGITLADGTSVNTSARNITVNLLNFTICNQSMTLPFLNISYKNETVASQKTNAFVSSGNIFYWMGNINTNKSYDNN